MIFRGHVEVMLICIDLDHLLCVVLGAWDISDRLVFGQLRYCRYQYWAQAKYQTPILTTMAQLVAKSINAKFFANAHERFFFASLSTKVGSIAAANLHVFIPSLAQPHGCCGLPSRGGGRATSRFNHHPTTTSPCAPRPISHPPHIYSAIAFSHAHYDLCASASSR